MIQLRRNDETLSRELTPAEKAALHLVAVDQAMDSVGANKWCDATRIVATTASQAKKRLIEETTFLEIACYCLYVTACGAIESERANIPEETLKQVGPTASARTLLAMRRDFLANLPML